MTSLKTMLAAAAITLTPVPMTASANDGESRYEALGRCMAYFAVVSGLDGTREISPDAARLIVALRDEFMLEASLLGHDDDTAHTFVVNRLAEINRATVEEGPEAVAAMHAGSCLALSGSLDG